MATANDIQHGGDHYKGAEYQHWDWVSDCKLHYLAGTASKYISRWRKKNGEEDLNKATHYVQKAMEVGVQGSCQTQRMASFWRFVIENDLPMNDAMICWYIMEGEWEAAALAISSLLRQS